MLKGLVGDKELTVEQEAHIQDLQDQIDEIWSRRGDYKIDDEAWKQMPIFMENITEEDVLNNESCAALSSIVYDGVPPEETASNRKEAGNKSIAMAMTPGQINPENLARSAYHFYTEGLLAQCNNRLLNAQLYANRSLAHFLMKNYGHGLEDGQRAVLMDPSYVKGFYRAAKCAEKIRKYEIALNLIDKAKCNTEPPIPDAQLQELLELEALCRKGQTQAQARVKRESQKSRADGAENMNIARAITSHGIKMAGITEVTSEQMNQYGVYKPYFDAEGLLHVSILFIYDEYDQSDFMQDVCCDVSAIELVDELMPFPWDERGRYAKLDDIVVVYKIDDGVQMPRYYEVEPSWPLLEVFRSETYQMPKLQPVLHIVAKSSELLTRWGLRP